MLIITTDSIPGKNLVPLGLVKGSTIQTVNAVRDIGAGLKTLIGGHKITLTWMSSSAPSSMTRSLTPSA